MAATTRPVLNKAVTRRSSIEGFTLIELIVVVTILMFSVSVVALVFTGFQRTTDVREAREQLKSQLRLAQSNAVSGRTAACPASRPSLLGWYIYALKDRSLFYKRARCFASTDLAFTDPAIFADSNYYADTLHNLPQDAVVAGINELTATGAVGTAWTEVEMYFLSAGKGVLFRGYPAATGGWVQCCGSGVRLEVGKGGEKLALKVTATGEIADAP